MHTLDGLGSLHAKLWGNVWFSLPQQTLDEVSDIPAGDGDVLDAAPYDISISLKE